MRIEMHNMNCFELFPFIEDESIDMVLADMPYNTTKCKWDTPINLEKLWPELKRISKPRTAIILFAQSPFDKILGCSNLEMLKQEIIWEKPNGTGFLNAKKMHIKAHENILIYYDQLPTYNPQKTNGHPRKTAGKKKILSEHYGMAIKKTHYDSTERYPRSIQKFSSDKQTNKGMHPCLKPLLLIEYLVKTFSNPGDEVLDFCFGGGTTPRACKNLNRNFIGCEKEKKYYKIAQDRLKNKI